MSNYYSKPKRVKAHTRRDPRINKRVSVNSYTRNQRYRTYKGIPREQALRLFNQRSNRAKAIDLSKTSKKVFEVPNEYWVKYMGNSDVKGIDTKTKTLSKNFYEDFYKFDKIERERSRLEGRIKFLETDIKYTPKELREPKLRELEQCKKDLEAIGDIQWQKEPSKWYWQ